jgi:hypothetical protein
LVLYEAFLYINFFGHVEAILKSDLDNIDFY